MDYMSWGEEYLTEAKELKNRVDFLRNQRKEATANEAKDMDLRIAIIYSMYLDCRETGKLLQSYAKRGGKL
ncbi:hypothetical protein [Clostridium merdae]|uniref:hypothetical protein n=1 Tax=Clostridium merdae TaxID=1958780 RepID=UPI000A269108|nr:hypothetical protein [Clostridium merdae]